MKILISIFLTAAITAAAAFVIISNQKEAAFKKEREKMSADWQAEKAKLESALASAKKKSGGIEKISDPTTSSAPTATKISAQDIVAELLRLKPSGKTRTATLRKIIYDFELLVILGKESPPEIGKFLALNQDIDYSPERTDENGDGGSDRRGPPGFRSRGSSTDFLLPPSLRIGLFDVLKEIGGEEAESILGPVLGTSGRAVEVAYLTRLLEEIAPGKYREVALEAAKSLLKNPLAINSPNRLDENAQGYLYGVLELYKDTSFSEDAKKLLVTADGRLDRNARDYLTKTQGEQAIPALYEAYKSNAISNNWDKISVAGKILDYVGPNRDANNFLNEIVSNPDIDSRTRSFSILRLAGGLGSDSPTDPQIIQSRMQVVEALKGGVTDERITQTLDLTQKNLQNLLDGKPIESPWRGDRRSNSRPVPATTQ